jgi:hypothetical protein
MTDQEWMFDSRMHRAAGVLPRISATTARHLVDGRGMGIENESDQVK